MEHLLKEELLRASSDRLCLKIDPADDQFCKERE
jgi:hypothetical protein